MLLTDVSFSFLLPLNDYLVPLYNHFSLIIWWKILWELRSKSNLLCYVWCWNKLSKIYITISSFTFVCPCIRSSKYTIDCGAPRLCFRGKNLPSMFGWHFDSQFPQLPEIWVPESSTFVEHHAGSPRSFWIVIQHLYVIPSNLNGNMQGLFASGPLVVVQSIPRQSER